MPMDRRDAHGMDGHRSHTVFTGLPEHRLVVHPPCLDTQRDSQCEQGRPVMATIKLGHSPQRLCFLCELAVPLAREKGSGILRNTQPRKLIMSFLIHVPFLCWPTTYTQNDAIEREQGIPFFPFLSVFLLTSR